MAHDFPTPSDPSQEVLPLAMESDSLPTKMTDGAALRDYAKHQSAKAFALLAERYAGLVYGTARRRTGSHELSQEIAQNVFAILARKASALAGNAAPLAGWLHRATVLESCQALRREGSRRRVLQAFAAEQEQAAAGAFPMNMDEIATELDEALDQLPRADRELLLARYFDGQSYHEIAAATGRNEAALMQQHHRALQKLSRLLRRNGHAATTAVLTSGLMALLTTPAPAGLASTCAIFATSATALAAGAGASTSALSFALAMQTKTQFALITAGLCLLAGTGGFLAARQLDATARRPSASSTSPLKELQPPGHEDGRSQAGPGLAVGALMPIPTALEVVAAEGRERVEKLALWLTTANPADIQEMLDNFSAMKPGPNEQTERRLIFQRWVEVDRPGAFTACRRLEGSTWTACEAWGRLHPQEAWAAVAKMDHYEQKNVLKGIIETDPGLAAKLVDKAVADGMLIFESQLYDLISDQLAAKNPAAGWEYALTHDARSKTAVQDWVRKDPDGATAFVLGQTSPRLRTLALSSLIWEFGEQHPEKINPLIEALPEGRLKWKAIDQHATILASKDPEAALAMVRQETNPATRAIIQQELAFSWADSKPQEALTILRTLDWAAAGNEYESPDVITASSPPNHFGESKAAEALYKLAKKGHLDEALGVAEAVPPGPKQEQALGAIAAGWPVDRVYELSEWVETQQTPSVRVAGARQIVLHLLRDKKPDYEAAARWAATLPPAGREGNPLLMEVIQGWRKTDAAAANEALKKMIVPEAVLRDPASPSPSPR